jgi:hypothetical protein
VVGRGVGALSRGGAHATTSEVTARRASVAARTVGTWERRSATGNMAVRAV